MEAAVERLTALVFILIGLSHAVAPGAWLAYFRGMQATGEAAGIHNALLHMPLGLVIAAFHPVWSGPGLAVTLLGWSLVLKGAIHLCFPRLAARSIRLAEGREWAFRAGGVLLALGGLAIGWLSLAVPPREPHSTSNRPAAPMPPPTHIVTTT